MTAKKRWLNKIYPDSQDFPKNTQIDISWSSSESDEEIFIKKMKVENSNKKWITSDLKQSSKIFLEEVRTKICQSPSKYYPSVSVDVWDLYNSPPDVIHVLDSPCSKINASLQQYCESPTINDVKLEELSPVLVQMPNDFNIFKEASPVLGNKRRMLKKIRSKYKTVRIVKQVDESSPDLFKTQSTQNIESDSPEMENRLPLESKALNTECIDPFPSQHSSQIINSNSESSSSVKDIRLYHQPVPKKKRYKKGGLASLLQKTLHLQRTRISIWQHEIYTKKTDNIISFEEGQIFDFIVRNKWKEYGNTLLESSSRDLLMSKHNLGLPAENVNLFIIVIGFSTNLNITFNTNDQYKLFPPYSVKTVNYKSREVPCYFNATKLVPLKDHGV